MYCVRVKGVNDILGYVVSGVSLALAQVQQTNIHNTICAGKSFSLEDINDNSMVITIPGGFCFNNPWQLAIIDQTTGLVV